MLETSRRSTGSNKRPRRSDGSPAGIRAGLVVLALLLPSFPAAGAPTDVPAEAERSAVVGPIRLTLRVYKTKVRPDESLWFQVRLENVGKARIVVANDLFQEHKDFRKSLRQNVRSSHGIYLVVTGPDGKKLDWYDDPVPFEGCTARTDWEGKGYDRVIVTDPATKRKMNAMVGGWRKSGLSDDQIQEKLNEYSRQQAEEAEERDRLEHPAKALEPGQFLVTRPWLYRGVCKGMRDPIPNQIGDFAELWNFKLEAPGAYRIRAVYDNRPSPWTTEYNQQHHKKTRPEQEIVHTPEVEVRVVP